MTHRKLRPLCLLALLTWATPRPAAAEEPALAQVLARAGEAEVARGQLACRFTMTSTIEELDRDGKVRGTLIRTYELEQHGYDVPTRKKLSEATTGDGVGMLLRQEPKLDADRRTRMLPFHPDLQAEYRFELKGTDEHGHLRVTFEPKEPDAKRLVGAALLDAETGELAFIEGRPSKLPLFLDQLDYSAEYTKGVCGLQQSGNLAKGIGGLGFIKSRFRARTAFSELKVVPAAPPSGAAK